MARKTYTEGTVTYGASGRRWKFETVSGYQMTTPHMPGGADTAHKVARVINGAVKRTKKGDIDNLARSNMATILHKAAAAVPKTRSLSAQGFYC